MNKTHETLLGMLRENVGSHFLDSGGTPKYVDGVYVGAEYGYGRQYERNQTRNIEDESPTVLKFSTHNGNLDIDFTIRTFHWLLDRCELNEELDSLFHGDFLKETDPNNDKCWLELMEEFPLWLAKKEDEDGNSIYGESAGIYNQGEPLTVNTYNEMCLLDQTLQFTYFTNDSGEFIALQIHGGADVRGGYTKPRIFSVGHHSDLDIFDYHDASIVCTGNDHHPSALILKEKQDNQLELPMVETVNICFDEYNDHIWSTDDGYNWYYQGCCGFGSEKQLEKYDAKNISEDSDEENKDWEPGVVCVKGSEAYCPYCGALLEGYPS